MSYFNITKNTFYRGYTIQVHDYKTPFYHLGITSEDLGCEDQIVRCLSIGFIFVIIRITTYAHTPGTIERYPLLNDFSMYPFWQRALIKLSQLLENRRRDIDRLL